MEAPVVIIAIDYQPLIGFPSIGIDARPFKNFTFNNRHYFVS